jgi:hypothetical protein
VLLVSNQQEKTDYASHVNQWANREWDGYLSVFESEPIPTWRVDAVSIQYLTSDAVNGIAEVGETNSESKGMQRGRTRFVQGGQRTKKLQLCLMLCSH